MTMEFSQLPKVNILLTDQQYTGLSGTSQQTIQFVEQDCGHDLYLGGSHQLAEFTLKLQFVYFLTAQQHYSSYYYKEQLKYNRQDLLKTISNCKVHIDGKESRSCICRQDKNKE